MLATNIGHRPARFYCFQNRDDLTLTELALPHLASWRHTRPETSTFQWSCFWGGLQSSPAVANGMIYFGGDDGDLYALH